MDARRWAIIESLYDAALSKDPGERSSYLAHECREHPELQAEVESLLRCAEEELNSPLQNCSSAPGLLRDVAFAPARVGDKLGAYEIVAHIGSGGMGDVYKARDTRLDRTVAIKFSKAQFTERFDREARAVAALNHPHICQLYDVGPNYLVFEYIDGARLKGPMPAPEALRVAMQIADALAEAHARGIIHRDLKPANILLTAHGVKVLDFGLAKRSREDEGTDAETRTMDLTRPGAVMGTPAYMAPEQWQGKPADTRSDIYAFGCVLYELLTGERPGRERIPLRQRELEAIVRGCLANDPDKRFQSAAELKSALSRAAKNPSRGKYAVVAAVLLLAALGALFLLKRGHAAPKLTDQDVLVVADFDNHTGDPVFDTALKQALAFQLQQSPFLKAMDDAEIRQALKLSGRSPDARVTGEIARDICIREGQKATLEGSIAVLGSRYLIGLQAVNCLTGETFAREQAEAAGKDQVVETLDRATNLMRARLGESLQTIQGEDRAYKQQISTSSLEALQVFEMVSAEWSRTGTGDIPLLRRATELDPNFAFAFAVLGSWYQGRGDKAAAKQMTEKAYALKDHVSERERLFIEDAHYQVLGDLRKAQEIEELLTRRYPRDPVFHSNLAAKYLEAGEPEKALPEAQAAIRNGPKIMVGYSFAVSALVELDRLDEAKAMAEKAIANGLDVPEFHGYLLAISVVAGDRQAQERETKWLMSNGAEAMTLWLQANIAFGTGHFKQAAKLIPKGIEMARRHPAGIPPSLYVEASQTANALVGRCLHGPAASQVVRALCDKGAAKKFVEQKAAGGENRISGPEAYIRGLALLAKHNSIDAAAVFQQMIDRKGFNWPLEYAAAHVGLARAAKSMGDTARARKAYEDFFALWKDADPDIPLLLQARKEYAALQ
jgi:eukaryotic-like serine/threonine-protein kinase